MFKFNKFLGDDGGAVSIDWVAIAAFILLLGIVVVYSIFNNGMVSALVGVDAVASGLTTSIVLTPPDGTTFGG